jgi:hypothetical protein
MFMDPSYLGYYYIYMDYMKMSENKLEVDYI